MMLTKDDQRLGLILGFVGPLLGLVLLYSWKFPSYTFVEFLDNFIHENRLITSIGLLVNAILFTIYVNTERDRTARGIFIVTLCYGVGILLLKLFN